MRVDFLDDRVPLVVDGLWMPGSENRARDGCHRVAVAADVRGQKDGGVRRVAHGAERDGERHDGERISGEVPCGQVVGSEVGRPGQIRVHGTERIRQLPRPAALVFGLSRRAFGNRDDLGR